MSDAAPQKTRAWAIDVLRGLVMVAMTLDHVRDYASAVKLSDPVAIETTPGYVFLARFLSHFCAPVFVLLAGVSARFVGERLERGQLGAYLAKRGAVLIALELTVVSFAWSFNFFYPMRFLQVIWALGIGMLVLALLVRLPPRAVLAIGVVIVAGHNVLDSVHVDPASWAFPLWSVLHEKNVIALGALGTARTTYPVLPVIGLIAVGYGIGAWFAGGKGRQLLLIGLAVTLGFVLLRTSNLYGDPHPFSPGLATADTLMAVVNTTKYPMSLLFIAMTLGPVLIMLGLVDGRAEPRWVRPLALLGRVPLFYYVTHLYVMHAALLAIALLTGFGPLDFRANFGGMPAGFALSMTAIVGLTLAVVAALVPFCAWYERQRRIRGRWLRYL